MEAEVCYIAKDGRRFTDALQCEEYEKTLGIIPNSVADVIQTLGKHDDKEYVFGIVFVRHRKDGAGWAFTRFTGCVDSKLEPFVNIKDLSQEQRYVSSTVGELKDALRTMDGDDPAQYMLLYSDNLEFTGFGVMASHNPQVWKDNDSKK